MDISAKSKINCPKLKAKVGRTNLRELLRPHFLQLLEDTIDPINLAIDLFCNGVMTRVEKDKVSSKSRPFDQNSELYQIVMKANAGEALINALMMTENIKILRLLQSACDTLSDAPTAAISNLTTNNLKIPIPSPIENSKPKNAKDEKSYKIPKAPKDLNKLSGALPTKPEANPAQIFVLKTTAMMTPPPNNEWIQTIGDDNLFKLNDDLWYWTLARVVTTGGDKSSRKSIQATKFHPEEPQAITKFLEFILELDLDKKTMGKPPLEIYINTRSFTHVEWQWLSKVLLLCRDSLENLWLDNVDYGEYCSGTKWLKTETWPSLRFNKLKSFIFVVDEDAIDAETLHRILVLLKSLHYPIEDFWNSGCAIHLWAYNYQEFLLVVDPVNKTLMVNDSGEEEDLTGEIAKIFQSNEPKSGDNRAAVTKLYYEDPQLDLISNVINRPLLTHLFLRFYKGNCIDVIQNVMDNLAEFKLLQKLFLSPDDKWTIDLTNLGDLGDLDNLTFFYCRNAELSGEVVDELMWRKSVQSVMLNTCSGWSLKTPGLESGLLNEVCVMLERNRPQNAKVPSQTFNVSLLSDQEVWVQIVRNFCT